MSKAKKALQIELVDDNGDTWQANRDMGATEWLVSFPLGDRRFDGTTAECRAFMRKLMRDNPTPSDVQGDTPFVHYLVRTGADRYDMRQTRYRAQLANGREHPHDVCAMGFTGQGIRDLVAQYAFDCDMSLLDDEEGSSHGH